MRFKIPQNSETVIWTKHSIEKMMHYHLSESRIKRVLHTPHRIEEGIAPQTIAVMQNAGTIKHPKEIWVMLQEIKTKQNKKSKRTLTDISHQRIRIISVWRYPGKTPIRELPKLPPEEWEFLQKGDFLE